MHSNRFSPLAFTASVGLSAIASFWMLNAEPSLAAQYKFTETTFSYDITGTFEINGNVGTILAGSFSSNQSVLIDLTGLEFDGTHLIGRTQSGTEFSTIDPPPGSQSFFQQISLAPQDRVPGGFTGFSTTGYVFEKVSDTSTSTSEPNILMALGLLAGSVLTLRVVSTYTPS